MNMTQHCQTNNCLLLVDAVIVCPTKKRDTNNSRKINIPIRFVNNVFPHFLGPESRSCPSRMEIFEFPGILKPQKLVVIAVRIEHSIHPVVAIRGNVRGKLLSIDWVGNRLILVLKLTRII